jgi:DNA polymerase-3 subunit epsilon
MVNVPVAADGTHFGPHLRHNGVFQVGDKGDERRFSDFNAALSYLKLQPRARWRRPNPKGIRGIVVAVAWADREIA